MTARIVELYGVASLQGLPEHGYRRFGMPPGGAFDLGSHRSANRMAGNADEARTLELGMAAAAIEFFEDAIVALAGATCVVSIGDRPCVRTEAIEVGAHSVLRVQPPEEGARCYVAVSGGWEAPKGPLRRGDELECGAGFQPARLLDVPIAGFQPAKPMDVPIADFQPAKPMDVSIAGWKPAGPMDVPIAGWKPAPQLQIRFVPSSSDWKQPIGATVGHRSDRVGVRLEGGPPGASATQISVPCTVGTLQQTPDGTLIVIGPDGPTIGGYAQIGTVISADLDCVGQLRPGERVELIPSARTPIKGGG